jgi:hypothetical protein
MTAECADEVRVQRRRNSPECEVIVTYRGREMSLRCRDYDQAIKWARIECKVYKLREAFVDERIG